MDFFLTDVDMTADALFGDAGDISSDSDDETKASQSTSANKIQDDDEDDEDNVRRAGDDDVVKVRLTIFSAVIFVTHYLDINHTLFINQSINVFISKNFCVHCNEVHTEMPLVLISKEFLIFIPPCQNKKKIIHKSS